MKSLASCTAAGSRRSRPVAATGATFRVWLPLHQSSDFAPLDPSHAMSPEELAGLRVLLVDDTDDALETLSYLLEHEGSWSRRASSAKAALDQIGKQPTSTS